MGKTILHLFIFSLLISPSFEKNITVNELEDIVDIVNHHELEIDEWQVTIKEKIPLPDAKKIMNKLDGTESIVKEEDKHRVSYSMINRHMDSHLVETYDIILPQHSTGEAEVIAVLKAEVWNEEVEENYRQWQHLMLSEVFTKDYRSYTCLMTEFNAIITNDHLLNYIMEKLEIQHFQTQNDTNKNSTLESIYYGYTPLWNQKVNGMDKPTNIQMAVTKNDIGARKFIIGTPILINEY